MIFVNSQAAFCARSKGRSSRPSINHACRRACACCLAFDLVAVYRWVPANATTRMGRVVASHWGVAPEPTGPPREGGSLQHPGHVQVQHPAMPEEFRQLAG